MAGGEATSNECVFVIHFPISAEGVDALDRDLRTAVVFSPDNAGGALSCLPTLREVSAGGFPLEPCLALFCSVLFCPAPRDVLAGGPLLMPGGLFEDRPRLT